MAFDMYIGNQHDSIDVQEEYILSMIDGDEKEYPQLNKMHLNFYGNVVFSSPEASELIFELLKLNSLNIHSNAQFKLLILRLSSFFSIAVRKNQEIICAGD